MARLFLVAILAFSFVAQDAMNLNWDVQLRERSNYNTTNDQTSMLHELRTRIGLKATATDNVSAFMQIQESRNLGSNSGGLANESTLGFHQAYLQLDKFFDTNVSLIVGRKEMVYTNQRIVGAVGWSNVGRTFDGGILRYSYENGAVDFFHMLTNETKTANDEGDRYFRGLHSTYHFSKDLQLDAFYYALPAAGTDDNRQTIGAFAKGKVSGVFYEVQFAKQMGATVADGADYAGTYWGALAGYKLTDDFTLIAAYDMLSGNDPDEADNTAFAPFAGTNHKFNGFMDKFYVGSPSKIAGVNGLNDLMIRAKYKGLMVDFHNFSTDFVADNKDPAIGNEIDLTYKYGYSKQLNVQLGASMFLFGDDYKNPSDKNDMYAYLMFIFNL